MEPWHFDPAAEVDSVLLEQVREFARRPNAVVGGLRLAAAVVVRCWLRVYHHLTIVGRDNLPTDRSCILVANHASHLDTPCLLASLPLRRLDVAFPVAAKDYFCVNATRALLARVVVNALPFERRVAPWQSLSLCAQLLAEPGHMLIVFPEGTRSGGREPGEFKPGVGLLAAGRDIPVVPCHLAGTHAALPKGAWFPRPKGVQLIIGKPRSYAHLPATKECAKRICRELREAVIALGDAAPVTETACSTSFQLATKQQDRTHLQIARPP